MKNGVSIESYFEKCRGVPLVIITIASISVSNNQIEQTMIGCACSMLWATGLQKMLVWKKKIERILLLSYYDLPSHLKTCLLYLHIFLNGPMAHEVEEVL